MKFKHHINIDKLSQTNSGQVTVDKFVGFVPIGQMRQLELVQYRYAISVNLYLNIAPSINIDLVIQIHSNFDILLSLAL